MAPSSTCFSALTALLVVSCRASADDECQAPGTCVAPDVPYQWLAPVRPREQWGDSGGYCGSLSIQTAALAKGAYISQDRVRKSAGPGGGHGDKIWGYEILHTNIEPALRKLKLNYEAFDYNTTKKPQNPAFKRFLKSQLAAENPVVWFIYCKGDGHDVYGFAHYDHIEPVLGIYSKHPLNDTTVYDDDVIAHTSDWDHNYYFRRMDSLEDTPKMDGNCANAVEGWKHNEAYPCIPAEVDYGFAIQGVADAGGKSLRVSIAIDSWSEPDYREFQKPVDFHANVTVRGAEPNKPYMLYVYDGPENVPVDGDYSRTAHHNVSFTPAESTWTYADPVSFKSNSAVYYFAVPV